MRKLITKRIVQTLALALLVLLGSALQVQAAEEDIFCLRMDDGVYKLEQDVMLNEDVQMGKNAVLDLNGYTLSFAQGKKLLTNTSSQILDTSADKSGKLAVNKGELLLANFENPHLPVWNGADGYLFLEPQLGEERAYFAQGSQTANGFVLYFRPGFGDAGGVNVRETYLKSGKSGITMNATLSWVRRDGAIGSCSIGYNNIFNLMYTAANARGEMFLTGADRYETITIAFTLQSCGVHYELEPVVYDTGKYITQYYGNDFNSGGTLTENQVWGMGDCQILNDRLVLEGTALLKLDAPIESGEGEILVMEFDYYLVDPNESVYDYFSLHIRPTGDEKYPIFSARKHYVKADAGITALYDTGEKAEENISDESGVHVRIELDLTTGASTVTCGKYLRTRSNPLLASKLIGVDAIYFREDASSDFGMSAPIGTAYQFDNIMIYGIHSQEYD